MKHPLSTTAILLLLFLATQLLGLALVSKAIVPSVAENGTITVAVPETPLGPPPETTPWGALLLIGSGVFIGTVLVLLLIKFRRPNWWRSWFFVAAALTMTVSFGVAFGERYYSYALLLGFALAAWKTWKPNPIVHNLTEMLIYPGIALLFYHILSVPSIIVLLLLVSAYDIYAVWKSKHMVSMALFQSESKVFAGLAIPKKEEAPYPVPPAKPGQTKSTTSATMKTATKTTARTTAAETPPRVASAILGGGDIAFPLLFASVVLKSLVLGGVSKAAALGMTSIIAVTTTIALAALFFLAKKDKFYPALPAVTTGCLVGYGIVLAIGLF